MIQSLPVGIQMAVVSASLLPDIDQLDLIGTSLYAHLAKNGHAPYYADQCMEAILAPVIAKQLDVDETMLFFYFERISQDVNQLPIEILQKLQHETTATFFYALQENLWD
ncbi:MULTISPECIES: UTRA domain-containing protein [unclassified Paenibacillus]|uniref:UTRA domain-containing protein n=1 Tax=unclassified Paenibacillus TaxID=185978 RepID=UPI003635F576